MAKKRAKSKRPPVSLSPYMTVRDANAAIDFYTRAFDAKETNRINVPDTDLVQHAELKICRTRVYICDELPAAGILAPSSAGGASSLLHLEVADAHSTWNAAIEAGATQVLPLAEVSWAGVCGKLVDPFGYYWSIAGEVHEASAQERVQDEPMQMTDIELSTPDSSAGIGAE